LRYFLLDANVLVAYYCADESSSFSREGVVDLFTSQMGGTTFLYLPNFCVVEILKAFAKKSWAENKFGKGTEADHAFSKLKATFLTDVVNSKILYSYELSRRHILLADKIYERASKISYRSGSPPSSIDVLIIAMGLDLSRIHGQDNFWIVTADDSVTDICLDNKKEMPQVVNLGWNRRKG